MSDATDRLNAAADRAEEAAEILHRAANDAAGVLIPTESGSVPSLAEFLAEMSDLIGDLPGLRDEVSDLSTLANAVQAALNLVRGADGAKQVPYRTYGRTVNDKLAEAVSPKDFGAVGDFVTDDTAKFQLAVAEAKTRRVPLLLNGDFGLTNGVIDSAGGLTIIGAGTLTAIGTDPYEAVLTIKNPSDLKIFGRLVISGAYRTNYAGGCAMYTDNGTQCSRIEIEGVSFVGCKNTWLIGRTSEPDALISEFSIKGGYTYGCPGGPVVIGTQTVLHWEVPNYEADYGTPPTDRAAAWAALSKRIMTQLGAVIHVHGGETLNQKTSAGVGFEMRPITSSANGNQYGSLYLHGVSVEIASQVVLITNPAGVGSLTAGAGELYMEGCDGVHTKDEVPLIYVADTAFSGRVDIGVNGAFATVTRTQPNIKSESNLCEINVKHNSFGRGFQVGAAGINGGKVPHEYRDVLRALNTNGQSLAANTQAVLKWTGVSNNNQLVRDASRYSTTTGQFTVGPEGLKDASIFVKIRTSALSANVDFAVFANGAYLTGTPRIPGDGVTGFLQATIPIGDIAAGTTLDVRATASAAAPLTGGGSETMIISGRA